jgi:hypothetical protein
MIFRAGSTFVFGSWICTADDCGQLQGRLVEIPALQASPVVLTTTLDHIIEKFSSLSIFDLGLERF